MFIKIENIEICLKKSDFGVKNSNLDELGDSNDRIFVY